MNKFLCRTILEEYPTDPEFTKDVRYVFQSVADRVQEGDIESITGLTDQYATLMLQAWKKHCEVYNLVWEYTPNSVNFCSIISSAFLFHSNNDKIPQIEWGAKVLTSSPSLAEYLNFLTDSKASLEVIHWVHIIVNETFLLKKKDTGAVVFTSPEHSNHHIWKFGRTFSKDPDHNSTWKIIDFNNCVRERMYNVLLKEQEHEQRKEYSKDVEDERDEEIFRTFDGRQLAIDKFPNARKLIDEWNLDTVTVWKHTCV